MDRAFAIILFTLIFIILATEGVDALLALIVSSVASIIVGAFLR